MLTWNASVSPTPMITAFRREMAFLIVAALLVLYSLVILLSAELAPDNTRISLLRDEQKISQVGLLLAMRQ